MTQQEIISFWIENSKDDLKSAKILFAGGQYLHTGFMCQQCVEKIIKGYFIHVSNTKQPHLHDVEILAEKSGLKGKLNDDQKQTLKKLKPLYIEARYEDYKNTMAQRLTELYCKKLLAETEAMMKWVCQLMK